LLKNCNLDVEISNEKMPISDCILKVDYVIGPPSTSFYDTLMLGKTPISIGNLDSRRQASVGELWEDNNRLMPFIFKPDSVEDLIDFINNGKTTKLNKEIDSILEEEADFPKCADSLDKICEICLESVVNPKNKKITLFLFLISRQVFFKIWRLKSRINKRRENSAMFILGKSEVEFIDNLCTKNSKLLKF
jgi:hypothetical protein